MKNTFQLKENISLAPLTTLKIGGRARFFASAESEETLLEALDFAERKDLPLFVLGGGSNVLISDRGFDGLVIQVALRGISSFEAEANGEVELTAQAGEDWDDFVAYCVERDLAGVECLSGIPGFVGGTPVQNVGAYGQEVSETIVSVRCFDRTTREFVTLANNDCRFTYRTSIFNTTERNRYVVLSVTFCLVHGGSPKVVYPELKQAIESSIHSGWREDSGIQHPSLGEVRDKVLEIRRAKSMVIDPDDPNSKSAGSFFKNPIVGRDKLEEIRTSHETVPHFEFGDKVKIPAAWLIEQAGFHKGYRAGPAGISARHTLALVNFDNASAGDILALKSAIQAAVEVKFGIVLQPEPVFIGF